MAITMKEVAEEAGVATSTVSRTIQNRSSISNSTKEKVRKAMEKLGYVPNFSAQSLASRQTRTIGVILPPFSQPEKASDPFFLEILRASSKVCSEREYTVAIASGDTTKELLESVRLMYLRKRIDGFLLLYSKLGDPVSRYLHDHNVPYVLIGCPVEFENEVSYVDNDNVLAGKMAAHFLIEKGHRKIGFVGFDQQEKVHQDRYTGYQVAMKQANLPTTSFYILEQANEYLQFQEYLRTEKPSALIAVDDLFALRLMQVVSVSNFKIPEDISLLSFNNSLLATFAHPFLTTIDIHAMELGRQATLQLLTKLSGDQEPIIKRTIPHELIQRETVNEHHQTSTR